MGLIKLEKVLHFYSLTLNLLQEHLIHPIPFLVDLISSSIFWLVSVTALIIDAKSSILS